MSQEIEIFDRRLLRQRRDRAAGQWRDYDFLFEEVGIRLAERLADIQRRFPLALDLGCHHGTTATCFAPNQQVDHWIQADISRAMVQKANGLRVQADEEFLPFADNSLDLVVSNLSLHWVNDLPGALIQIRRALKPDGLFFGAIFGLATLMPLREAFLEAEIAVGAGNSPHLSPFTDLRDAGGLLQRAGFALPVVDADIIEVSYENVFKLMADLRGMGEGNNLIIRNRRFLRRDVLMKLAEIYHQKNQNDDGRVRAQFQVIYLHGWKPHDSQQKALKPGSAQSRLADALGTVELTTGEKPGD